jgi:hypothetical protein
MDAIELLGQLGQVDAALRQLTGRPGRQPRDARSRVAAYWRAAGRRKSPAGQARLIQWRGADLLRLQVPAADASQ